MPVNRNKEIKACLRAARKECRLLARQFFLGEGGGRSHRAAFVCRCGGSCWIWDLMECEKICVQRKSSPITAGFWTSHEAQEIQEAFTAMEACLRAKEPRHHAEEVEKQRMKRKLLDVELEVVEWDVMRQQLYQHPHQQLHLQFSRLISSESR